MARSRPAPAETLVDLLAALRAMPSDPGWRAFRAGHRLAPAIRLVLLASLPALALPLFGALAVAGLEGAQTLATGNRDATLEGLALALGLLALATPILALVVGVATATLLYPALRGHEGLRGTLRVVLCLEALLLPLLALPGLNLLAAMAFPPLAGLAVARLQGRRAGRGVLAGTLLLLVLGAAGATAGTLLLARHLRRDLQEHTLPSPPRSTPEPALPPPRA